jgi:hypothetical protein
VLFLYYTLRQKKLSTDNRQTFDTMELFNEHNFHTSQVKNDLVKDEPILNNAGLINLCQSVLISIFLGMVRTCLLPGSGISLSTSSKGPLARGT